MKQHEFDRKNHENWQSDPNDGTFLMCFKDWRNIFNNLFLAKKFPSDFSGIRYFGKWDKQTSGGLQMKPTPEAMQTFAKNKQYRFKLKTGNKETKIFIRLVSQMEE